MSHRGFVASWVLSLAMCGCGSGVSQIAVVDLPGGAGAKSEVVGPSGNQAISSTGKPARLIDSNPTCDQIVSRAYPNVFRLYFDGPITVPKAGQLRIHSISDEGNGEDVAQLFEYTIEDESVLRLFSFDAIEHVTWYSIETDGSWPGVAPFTIHFVAHFGNVNGDNWTNYIDISVLNQHIGVAQGDDDPYNINGDDFVNKIDMSLTNVYISSRLPEKPEGYECVIP